MSDAGSNGQNSGVGQVAAVLLRHWEAGKAENGSNGLLGTVAELFIQPAVDDRTAEREKRGKEEGKKRRMCLVVNNSNNS